MASNSLQKLALLGIVCLCALIADVHMAVAQDYDFGRRQFFRDVTKETNNLLLEELLEETQRLMSEERDAQFEREQDLKDAENDALISDIEDEQERRGLILLDQTNHELDKLDQEQQQELALRALPLDAEETTRIQAARETQTTLVDTYCNINSTTAEGLASCQQFATILDLPLNYRTAFYALFPEYDPASTQQTRDIDELVTFQDSTGEIDDQTIPR